MIAPAARRAWVRVSRRGLARTGLATLAANAAMVVINVPVGILTARTLGTEGRGALAAVVAAPPVVGLVAGLSIGAALSYHHARDPADGRVLLSSAAALLVPISVVSVAGGETLIHFTLSTQGETVRRLAFEYMLVCAAGPITHTALGMLVGGHRYALVNAVRVGQPLCVLVAYALLAWRHALTVESAVLTLAIVAVAATAYLVACALIRHRLCRPTRRHAWRLVRYGAQGHGAVVASTANMRLDQVILPAYVSTADVGLYAVAVTISGLIFSLGSSLIQVLLPAVTARRGDQERVVMAALHATLGLGVLLAAAIVVVGPAVIRTLYGGSFSGAVGPMLILVPGSVLYLGGVVLWLGLFATGKPHWATGAEATALAVTVAGLLVLLPRGAGIVGAAAVSTVAYTIVLVVSAALYARARRRPLRLMLGLPRPPEPASTPP